MILLSDWKIDTQWNGGYYEFILTFDGSSKAGEIIRSQGNVQYKYWFPVFGRNIYGWVDSIEIAKSLFNRLLETHNVKIVPQRARVLA